MPEITRKRTGELLRKLFRILMEHPEGLQASEALEALVKAVALTPYEAGNYESSGTRRFEKIVRFATVDCVKAGWLVKEKGNWSISETGAQAYKAFPDPEAFYKEAVRLYRAWKAGHADQPRHAGGTLDPALRQTGRKRKASASTYANLLSYT